MGKRLQLHAGYSVLTTNQCLNCDSHITFGTQDHASGSLLVTEAGGIVTDMYGKPLDFSVGRTLSRNTGIVASGAEIHREVLDCVTAVLEEKSKMELDEVESAN